MQDWVWISARTYVLPFRSMVEQANLVCCINCNCGSPRVQDLTTTLHGADDGSIRREKGITCRRFGTEKSRSKLAPSAEVVGSHCIVGTEDVHDSRVR